MAQQGDIAFEDVWNRIRALEQTTVPLASRGQIDILTVDEQGVIRRTSRGNTSRMSIDSFRWTVNEVNSREHLSREEILEGIHRWESSGVVAILAATGLYEVTHDPKVGLRVRR